MKRSVELGSEEKDGVGKSKRRKELVAGDAENII